MKKKVTNGILIVGVLTIWVFVAKKAMAYFDTNKKTVVLTPIAQDPLSVPIIEKDTFQLDVPNRDPFLSDFGKNSQAPRAAIKEKKALTKSKTKKTIHRASWPKLKYFGYIKGKDKANEMALIKVDNKLHRVRAKERIDDILIYSVYADSVVLKYNHNFKTLVK